MKYLARAKQSFEVFSNTEQVDLLMFLVPIATDTFEARGTIRETVCTYRNYTLLGGYELAIHEEYFRVHLVCGK